VLNDGGVDKIGDPLSRHISETVQVMKLLLITVVINNNFSHNS